MLITDARAFADDFTKPNAAITASVAAAVVILGRPKNTAEIGAHLAYPEPPHNLDFDGSGPCPGEAVRD